MLLRERASACYVRIGEIERELGFVASPAHDFRASRNGVRLTAAGMLHMRLGQDNFADPRAPPREGACADTLEAIIAEAIARKPEEHDFRIDERAARPGPTRPMSRTGD